jgi:hypothetical protein
MTRHVSHTIVISDRVGGLSRKPAIGFVFSFHSREVKRLKNRCVRFLILVLEFRWMWKQIAIDYKSVITEDGGSW